ncbi:MAG TPA: two-component regulator propeller domain-containing protein, partial [Saprospiraceae bacterium]|nr:two-component regulator propeller domain-containing protein [Saprospiraceae bacterium]
MKNQLQYLLLLITVVQFFTASGQEPAFNFLHFTPHDGLSNDAVRGIAEDKYGFIWAGTNHGLNRIDGIHVKTYYHQDDDPKSLGSNFIRSLFSDSRGRIWVGSDPGLCYFDYPSGHFIHYKNADFNIQTIIEDGDGVIWMGTGKGLRYADTINDQLIEVNVSDTTLKNLLSLSCRDLYLGKKNMYIATAQGVIQLELKTKKWQLINAENGLLSNEDARAVTEDHDGNLWVATGLTGSVLHRIDLRNNTSESYTYFQKRMGHNIPNMIRKLKVDHEGRLWIGSTYLGVSLYSKSDKNFKSFIHDPVVPNSYSSELCNQIFQDSKGIIWLGTEGSGLNYFNPEKALF